MNPRATEFRPGFTTATVASIINPADTTESPEFEHVHPFYDLFTQTYTYGAPQASSTTTTSTPNRHDENFTSHSIESASFLAPFDYLTTAMQTIGQPYADQGHPTALFGRGDDFEEHQNVYHQTAMTAHPSLAMPSYGWQFATDQYPPDQFYLPLHAPQYSYPNMAPLPPAYPYPNHDSYQQPPPSPPPPVRPHHHYRPYNNVPKAKHYLHLFTQLYGQSTSSLPSLQKVCLTLSCHPNTLPMTIRGAQRYIKARYVNIFDLVDAGRQARSVERDLIFRSAEELRMYSEGARKICPAEVGREGAHGYGGGSGGGVNEGKGKGGNELWRWMLRKWY